MISLSLPFPPSLNCLFRNVTKRDGKPGGRITTARYRTWLRAAKNEVLAQQQIFIVGPVMLTILLGRPDKCRRDCSNYIKALEDLLVRCELIEDDSLVQSLSVTWCDKVPAKTARVLVWPYTAERQRIKATAPLAEAAE